MRVDVWADIVCPWCYLGAARFGAALRQFEHRDEVEVVHHSFELDPGRPAGDTQPVLDVLAAKYGMSPAQVAAVFDEVGLAAVAAAAGLDAGQAQAALADAQAEQQMADDLQQARQLGISGVPFYVIGGSRPGTPPRRTPRRPRTASA